MKNISEIKVFLSILMGYGGQERFKKYKDVNVKILCDVNVHVYLDPQLCTVLK